MLGRCRFDRLWRLLGSSCSLHFCLLRNGSAKRKRLRLGRRFRVCRHVGDGCRRLQSSFARLDSLRGCPYVGCGCLRIANLYGGILIAHSQRVVDYFECRVRGSRDSRQPSLPRGGIDYSVCVSERICFRSNAVLGRNPADQGHADLRSETGAQTESILDWVDTALGQI